MGIAEGEVRDCVVDIGFLPSRKRRRPQSVSQNFTHCDLPEPFLQDGCLIQQSGKERARSTRADEGKTPWAGQKLRLTADTVLAVDC
jgi:hypothetical protein